MLRTFILHVYDFLIIIIDEVKATLLNRNFIFLVEILTYFLLTNIIVKSISYFLY